MGIKKYGMIYILSAGIFFLFSLEISFAASPGAFSLNVSGLKQQVDPFYLRMLENGKTSFQNEQYRDAITELEVGIFGLKDQPRLQGEGYIYLALSHYYLKEMIQAENNLAKAIVILEVEGLLQSDLPDSHQKMLKELLVEFEFRGPEVEQDAGVPVIEPERPLDPEAEIPARPERIEAIQNLEERIQSHPKEKSAYLRLYSLYIEGDQAEDAKDVLKKLIKQNPDSARGYYLLGRLFYYNNKFKKAEKHLEQVFQISSRIEVRQDILTLSRVYQLLAAYLRGDRERAAKMASGSMDVLTDLQIEELPLTQPEKQQLRDIMESARKR